MEPHLLRIHRNPRADDASFPARGREVRLSARVTFRAGLLWAMGLILTAYAGGLVLRGQITLAV